MLLGARLLRFKTKKTAADVDSVLSDLVREAARFVPFYRDLFRDAGTDVSSFGGARDLATLPRFTKETFLESRARDRLREGRDPLRCASTSTSGSTGRPVTIYLARPELYFRRYTLLASFGRYVRIRLPLRLADVGPMVPHRGRSVEQRLGLVNVLRLPGTLPLAEQREALLRYRPGVLEGYPTCLGILAESLSEREARRLRPLLVVCRGETLRQETRSLLGRTFRAQVANLYNCEEVGNLAWECPEHAGRFHLNQDTSVVEVLTSQEHPPHGRGDIVVTSLYNWTMPLLRYPLGDKAALLTRPGSPCSCGAGAWLEELTARDDDLISFPGGRRVSPRVFTNALFNALRSPDDPHQLNPHVSRYQIVQEEDFSIRVGLEWQGAPDPALWHRIADEMERVSRGLRCTVERMETVELTPAGKFKMVVSRAPTGRRV